MWRWTKEAISKIYRRNGRNSWTWVRNNHNFHLTYSKVTLNLNSYHPNSSSKWSKMFISSSRTLQVSLFFRNNWARERCVRYFSHMIEKKSKENTMLVVSSNSKITEHSTKSKQKLRLWNYATHQILLNIFSLIITNSLCSCLSSLWMEEPWLILSIIIWEKYLRISLHIFWGKCWLDLIVFIREDSFIEILKVIMFSSVLRDKSKLLILDLLYNWPRKSWIENRL